MLGGSDMMYEGYRIVHDRGHILVIAPDGTSWTEDTVEDAKNTIDSMREDK